MTRLLVRLALRSDRVLLPLWTLALVAIVGVSGPATADLFPDPALRATAAGLQNSSPALVALYGPILDPTSLGELAMAKTTVLYATVLAGLGAFLVRRHTRTEEEAGRSELLGGAGAGSDVALRAAVLTALVATGLVGLLAGAADVLGGLPATGSVAFGLGWVGVGWVGVGIGAVTAQASASVRTCGGLALGVLAGLYAVRAVADTGPEALGWLSPLGWPTRLHAWSEPRWWVLALFPALTAALLALAARLAARRDLGSGLLAARPGPLRGPARRRDVLALQFALEAPSGRWWALGTLAGGLLCGAIVPAVGGLLDTPTGRAMIEVLGGTGALRAALVTALVAVVGLATAAAGLGVVARVAGDEASGRLALPLAGGVSRRGLVLAVLASGLLTVSALLVVLGLGITLGLGVQGIGTSGAWTAVAAQAPAAWLVLALGVLGWAATAQAWWGWAVLAGSVLLDQLRVPLHLPGWVADLSPYAHVPTRGLDAGPWLLLSALAALAGALAVLAIERRDVAA